MKPHPKIIDKILEGVRNSRTFCVVGHTRHAEPDGVFTVVYDAKGRLDKRKSDLNGDGRPDGAS